MDSISFLLVLLLSSFYSDSHDKAEEVIEITVKKHSIYYGYDLDLEM